jgi:hypothetical protein
MDILDGATVTTNELNELDNIVADVGFTISGDVANVVTVNCQFKDASGSDMATVVAVPFYLADDAAGLGVVGTAPDGGFAAGTDGSLSVYETGKSGLAVSEADGDFDIAITESGAKTCYLVFVMPNGSIVVSAVITHEA